MHGSPPLPAPPPLATLLERATHSLFLDFDGTLVGIASRPGDIHVPDDLATRIKGLSDRVDGRLAIVTGRALDDLERHLGPVGVARAGSHGASRFHADGARLGDAPDALSEAVIASLRHYASTQGLFYEEKRHGGALHFRGQPQKAEAVMAFARSVAQQHGLVLTIGKSVAELVRPGADKGAALRAFMQTDPFAGSTPIFVGDDVTDEDGMRGAIEFAGFGIAVGERPSEAARYHLPTVEAVHAWLEL